MKKQPVTERVLNTLIFQEQEGYTFYREAAMASDDPKTAKLFEKLAADEVQHEISFRKLLEAASAQEVALMENEALYLDLLLLHFGPNTPEKRAKARGVVTRHQALNVAEEMERNAIFLLSEVMSLNPGLRDDVTLVRALKEERSHLTDILQQKQSEVAGSLML